MLGSLDGITKIFINRKKSEINRMLSYGDMVCEFTVPSIIKDQCTAVTWTAKGRYAVAAIGGKKLIDGMEHMILDPDNEDSHLEDKTWLSFWDTYDGSKVEDVASYCGIKMAG